MLYRDAFGFVEKDEDNFNIICGEFVITINNNDNVLVTQYTPTSNVPQAYTLSNTDELPIDALDGSIARVLGQHNILGTWYFNDVIDMTFTGYDVGFSCDDITYTNMYDYGSLQYGTSERTTDVYTDNQWVDEKYRTVNITNVESSKFVEFMYRNASKIKMQDVWYIYVRTNGDWENTGYVV